MSDGIFKTRETYKIVHGDTRVELYFYPRSLGYEILRIRIERDKLKNIEEFVRFFATLLIIQQLITNE